MTSSTETANWQLLPIVCSARGSKSAQILCNNAPIKVKLEPTKAPFGAGVWNQTPDITRLNLDLQCSNYLEFLQKVDDWAIDKLAANSSQFFKKTMSKEEIKGIFKPSASPHEKNNVPYEPTFRCKINVAGANVVKCWNADRSARSIPDDWRGATITPEVTIKGLWFMQGGCGIVFEVHNCIVEEESAECPF